MTMPESVTPLSKQLARLKAEEASARADAQTATYALRNEWHLARDLLSEYWDGGNRDKDPTAEELRERTARLISAVQERGLAFALDKGMPGHRAIVPVSPELREKASEAQRASGRARAARIHFEAANAAALQAEKSAAAAQQVREALAGDDVDKIREALATEA